MDYKIRVESNLQKQDLNEIALKESIIKINNTNLIYC